MSIWEYKPVSETLNYNSAPKYCIYCREQMRLLASRKNPTPQIDAVGFYPSNPTELKVCDICGWWSYEIVKYREYRGWYGINWDSETYLAMASLKTLDITSSNIPIDTLRKYLIPKYENRFHINARRLEEIINDVYKDFGFRTRLTSYSNDKGIDIHILDGNDNSTIGIQVKRYKNKIELKNIVEFAGALVLNGLTKGIFFTTSEYTKGAKKSVSEFAYRNIGLELKDAESLYTELKIANRKKYTELFDKDAPFADYTFSNIFPKLVHTDSGYFE